jgi:trehalose-6-phosphate synthase
MTNAMRLSLRFVVPLLFALALIAYALEPLVDRFTLAWFTKDLDIRTEFITNTVNDPIAKLINENSERGLQQIFDKMVLDERLYAVGLCSPNNKFVYRTSSFPLTIDCAGVDATDLHSRRTVNLPQGLVHLATSAIRDGDLVVGKLVLIHDMSFIQRRSEDSRKFLFYLFVLLGSVVSVITIVIAQLSWKGWVRGMRSIIRGEGFLRPITETVDPVFRPIAKDLRALVRELDVDRKTRDESQMVWSPKTLKEILQRELAGEEILIVSNRQPYIHTLENGKIEVKLPASGLVTALEPVMRACSGTWIAHGSGSADRDVVDKNDRVKVPPENPSYHIRRLWLTKEEEEGYYYGFSNEGLWPLCHMAHTRPVFRAEDWNAYVKVNQKFADTVVQEAKTEDPVILVQDYHLALVPRMIKNVLPKATIITFWHIPWPNPEAFGICPWRNKILDGMLGSNILGFHTRFHCNNFIETVDRYIESRIDNETSTISYGGELTAVNSYPISIEWPVKWLEGQKSISECQDKIQKLNGLNADCKVGVGVDRLDYTKGILERFLAVERFLELNPQYIGKFCFIQIAAPSRSTLEQYQMFEAQVRNLANRINKRFSGKGCLPICLKIEHHEPHQVYEYFRGCDLCFVSSLHDGMNLVAKEFVASRDDNAGSLILSQFAGASRELPQALIVNPYDLDQCAEALRVSLEMPITEQRDRMRTMRGIIQDFNVYRWAGRMLIDAARIRQHRKFIGKFGSGLETNVED